MIWCRRDIHTLAIHYTLCTDEVAFHKELRRLKVKGGVEDATASHAKAKGRR